MSLIVGILMTYLLIRRMPTLMRGSKRVVVVKNRHRNDVMVMPNNLPSPPCPHRLSNSSKVELPTYLTPLPRKSSDTK